MNAGGVIALIKALAGGGGSGGGGGGGGGVLVVEIGENDTLNKTFREIADAQRSGKIVLLVDTAEDPVITTYFLTATDANSSGHEEYMVYFKAGTSDLPPFYTDSENGYPVFSV